MAGKYQGTETECKRGHSRAVFQRVSPQGGIYCNECARVLRHAREEQRRNNPKLTAEQRTMRARLAAYARHAKSDGRESTAKARATFMRSFEDQVDPDRTLPEEERQRRAEVARKEHFSRLALKSSIARSRKTQ